MWAPFAVRRLHFAVDLAIAGVHLPNGGDQLVIGVAVLGFQEFPESRASEFKGFYPRFKGKNR